MDISTERAEAKAQRDHHGRPPALSASIIKHPGGLFYILSHADLSCKHHIHWDQGPHSQQLLHLSLSHPRVFLKTYLSPATGVFKESVDRTGGLGGPGPTRT